MTRLAVSYLRKTVIESEQNQMLLKCCFCYSIVFKKTECYVKKGGQVHVKVNAKHGKLYVVIKDRF